MPLFYQHNINDDEKLGVWKIEEDENFFLSRVPPNREISHQHKRLQHLAGRYLLQHLFPNFPYELIQIADTRKPFLFNEAFHFSISHCNDYAAALVSRRRRVGVDIELVTPTIQKIAQKFLSTEEINYLDEYQASRGNEHNLFASHRTMRLTENAKPENERTGGNVHTWESEQLTALTAASNGTESIMNINLQLLTLCWSAKEAMYKWYGDGLVDFKKHMQLTAIASADQSGWIEGAFLFQKEKPVPLLLRSRFFQNVVITYVIS